MYKYILITDLHYGKHHNSEVHLDYLSRYTSFIADYVKSDDQIRGVFILGDVFDHRHTINTKVLNAAYNDLKKIYEAKAWSSYFNSECRFNIIIGNHDCYNKNNRDIHPLKLFSFANIIDTPNVVKLDGLNFGCIPYLFDADDADKVLTDLKKSEADFILGHLEISGFGYGDEYNFNDAKLEEFNHVFSGHFHKRQSKGNITYVGNPFAMNFKEAFDGNKGGIELHIGTDDYSINNIDWNEGPVYAKVVESDLKELLANCTRDLYINVEVDDASIITDIRNYAAKFEHVKHIEFKVNQKYEADEEVIHDLDAVNLNGIVSDFIENSLEVNEAFDKALLNDMILKEIADVTV